MTTTTTEHRDATPAEQPYVDGKFVSHCSCGAESFGDDPDHADYQLLVHSAPTRPPTNPPAGEAPW